MVTPNTGKTGPEMDMGAAATMLIVETLIQKIKRNLGNEKQVVNATQEEMEAYAIQIFQAAIDKVKSSGEIKILDDRKMGEISFKIVKHRFQKGLVK